eukprot:TRINITY_DN44784_c0_g1_i1.p1 TRINITY_DN44784_c0_g1~~TRINITY_DN44784_c0_g1_i1.p1  ORF type:complete len:566 (-),score=80.67 TRINITY_DN44784_c0_g1_i1:105-1802(-)
MWSFFVQYPDCCQVLREIAPPRSVAEFREALEVTHEQHVLVSDRHEKNEFSMVEDADQLYDGASICVTVPRRRIFVSLEGQSWSKPVAWYPGATAEQIEKAIAKACGLPPKTSIELIDGDMAVVISATIPNNSRLTAVPLPAANGSETVAQANGVQRQTITSAPRRSGADSPRRSDTGIPMSARDGPRQSTYTPSVPAATRSQSVRTSTVGTGVPAATGPPRSESTFVGRTSSRAASPQRDRMAGVSGVAGSGNAPVDLAAQPTGHVSAPDEHCVHILAGHAGFVLSLCTVGDVLFTGSQDCNIMIWDLNNMQYIGTLPGHRGFVKCMVPTLARKMLCSGSQDKTIRIWSLESFSSTKTLHGHTSEVNTLTILEGTDVLVSGSEDRSIRVWDLGSLVLLASLEQAHGSSVFALAQLDGGLFLSASRDRTVKVWLASTWQARRTLSPPHYDGVSDLTVGTQRTRFYSASRDRSIRRWDARSFDSDLQLTHAHGDWLTSLALSPSENMLFSGSKDCVVKVWDSDLHCKDLLLGHRGAISSLITIDGLLLSASHDRTVRAWRVSQYES